MVREELRNLKQIERYLEQFNRWKLNKTSKEAWTHHKSSKKKRRDTYLLKEPQLWIPNDRLLVDKAPSSDGRSLRGCESYGGLEEYVNLKWKEERFLRKVRPTLGGKRLGLAKFGRRLS